jgi:hypothetical protein
MGVSWNRGTPKSSILIGLSIINHPFCIPIYGNVHFRILFGILFVVTCTEPTTAPTWESWWPSRYLLEFLLILAVHLPKLFPKMSSKRQHGSCVHHPVVHSDINNENTSTTQFITFYHHISLDTIVFYILLWSLVVLTSPNHPTMQVSKNVRYTLK